MARVPGTFFVRNLVERRGLIFQLVRRDFEQRFVGSAAGWLWGVIHPLVLLTCYTFVFSFCFKMKIPPGQGTRSYALYLFAGMLPWLLFSETVQRSSNSLLEHSGLITKTVFPAEVVPISVFLSSLISHGIALVLVIAAIAVKENHVSPLLALLPIYVALLGLFAVGIGWIAASLQVYVRDTVQALTVLLTFWFWLTPIFFTEDQVPEGFRFLVKGNPLAYVVRVYRQALLSYRTPDLGDLGILALCASVTFVLGGLFFRHMKRGFADVL
jgi:ABC-type polysaccharide/polyol phosphate export permease